mmetsp:Transcript_15420/g.47718  ORF Transcript_15420/g.47718 Transcript_15420/m.47718 type:complete len:255 (+) Transcript_15420:41-805(+)
MTGGRTAGQAYNNGSNRLRGSPPTRRWFRGSGVSTGVLFPPALLAVIALLSLVSVSHNASNCACVRRPGALPAAGDCAAEWWPPPPVLRFRRAMAKWSSGSTSSSNGSPALRTTRAAPTPQPSPESAATLRSMLRRKPMSVSPVGPDRVAHVMSAMGTSSRVRRGASSSPSSSSLRFSPPKKTPTSSRSLVLEAPALLKLRSATGSSTAHTERLLSARRHQSTMAFNASITAKPSRMRPLSSYAASKSVSFTSA